jgi:hypothetical protein
MSKQYIITDWASNVLQYTGKFNFSAYGANVGSPMLFDEFCNDFGYEFKNESEYIKTKSIHLACLDQMRNLRKLFTSDQLELLSEIN